MSPESFLLILGVVAWWYGMTRLADPEVTICRGCGDLIEKLPGWPTRCPSCSQFII